MNTRNVVTLTGYFPNQEKMGKAVMYREGSGDKKSFYRGKISVMRAFKDKDGNHRYDWIPFTCFGHSADFINKYVDQTGKDMIQIMGEIQISDNYEDKDGNTVYGQPFVLADSVSIVNRSDDNTKGSGSDDGGSNNGSKEPAKHGSNPLAKLRARRSA